jgi:hypothetical protein
MRWMTKLGKKRKATQNKTKVILALQIMTNDQATQLKWNLGHKRYLEKLIECQLLMTQSKTILDNKI